MIHTNLSGYTLTNKVATYVLLYIHLAIYIAIQSIAKAAPTTVIWHNEP